MECEQHKEYHHIKRESSSIGIRTPAYFLGAASAITHCTFLRHRFNVFKPELKFQVKLFNCWYLMCRSTWAPNEGPRST
jgi:hypothetical protein